MPKRTTAITRKPLTAMLTRDWQTGEGEGMTGALVVVCDDGAAFSYSWHENEWRELAAVPGSRRQPIKAREDAVEKARAVTEMDAGIRAYRKRTQVAKAKRDAKSES
jgi:hypothetical protein